MRGQVWQSRLCSAVHAVNVALLMLVLERIELQASTRSDNEIT